MVGPPLLWQQVLNALHQGQVIHVWWLGIDEEIKREVHRISCYTQQDNPAVASLHPREFPSNPWQRLHLEFACPCQGWMRLIVMDARTKWLEVIQMREAITTT